MGRRSHGGRSHDQCDSMRYQGANAASPRSAAMRLPSAAVARGLAVVATVLVVVGGCSLPKRLAAVPRDETTLAQIPGIPNARYFPDTQIDLLAAETLAARNREIAALAVLALMAASSPAMRKKSWRRVRMCWWPVAPCSRPAITLAISRLCADSLRGDAL